MDSFKSLQDIIKLRRTTRSFSNEILSIETVNEILKSAIYAPYGGATGIPLKEIRKLFVFRIGSKSMDTVNESLISALKSNAKKVNIALMLFPFLKKKMGSFSNRLNSIVENGIPSLKDASHFIIVAEKKGFPPVQKQSLAHAMQNMWLCATSLGVGFQLISATGILSNNSHLLELLKIPKGKYQLDGCVIGIPKNKIEPEKESEIDEFVTWIS